MKVHHLAVLVRDLARAEEFYTRVLGLSVLRRHQDEHGAPRSVWLALDEGAFLAVEKATVSDETKPDGAPGWHCVALEIPPGDREVWRARLTAAGCPVATETAYTLYTHDPDGNLVALSHYPHEHPA